MKMTAKILFLSIVSLFMVVSLVSCKDKTSGEPTVEKTPEVTKYTITFDSDGGSSIESIQVESGKKASKPTNPTKEGYNFLGWFLEDDEWSFIGYVVTENITLKAKWEEEIKTPEHTHEYINEVVEPTCVDKGYTKHTCSCGETYNDAEVEALGHTEVTDDAVESTCTSLGLTEGKHCSVCKEVLVKQASVPAKGHTYGEWEIITSPTETEIGSMKQVCLCGHENVVSIPIITHEHRYISQVVEPTCVDKGYTKHICACGETYNDAEVEALGHTEVTDEAVESTCTSLGLTAGKHCSICEEVIVEQTSVPAKGHTEVIDKAVEPTCTTTGLTAGKHCSVCKEVLVKQASVPAKGHTYGEWEIITSPTETEIGSMKQVCLCGHENVVSIPTIAHEHRYISQVVEPTCVDKGYTKHICACGETYNDTEVSAKGHNFDYDEGVCTVCHAEERVPTEGFSYFTSWDLSFYYVSSYEGDESIITIPNEFDGLPVKGIFGHAFINNTNITEVYISNNIEVIEMNAFAGCENLKSVHIRKNSALKKIHDGAFRECISLENIYIPNGVELISATAFRRCESLTTINIPKNITQILPNTFENCTKLETLITQNTLTTIYDSAFLNCENLKEVYFGGNISDWDNIKIKNGNDILYGGVSIYYYSNFPPNVPDLYWHYDSDGKTPVLWDEFDVISNMPESGGLLIEDYVILNGLGNCTDETVVIPHGVTSIGDSAFYGAEITAIVIPETVTSIGEEAFSHSFLEIVIFKGESKLEELKYGAFSECNDLSFINLPDSVKIIGDYAFRNCYALRNIDIDNASSLGKGVFDNCSLTSVIIPKTISSIKEGTFNNNIDLENVVIPVSIKNIESGVFKNCFNMAVYYEGTIEEWDTIIIAEGSYQLDSAVKFYYSETKPTTSGNYWHYDIDGQPVAW